MRAGARERGVMSDIVRALTDGEIAAMTENSYFNADMHYDLEEAEKLADLRKLFRQQVDAIRYDGLQEYKIHLPGKYGRIGGGFVFKGVLKHFSYELTIKLKGKGG